MFCWFPEIKLITVNGYLIPLAFVFFQAAFVGIALTALYETKRLKLNLRVTLLAILIFYSLSQLVTRSFWVAFQIFLGRGWDNLNSILSLDQMREVASAMFLALLVGILLSSYLYNERKNLSKYFDAFTFGIVAGIFIQRIGCSLTHFYPGRIIESEWVRNLLMVGPRHNPSLYVLISMVALLLISIPLRKKISLAGGFTLFALSWMSFTRVITDFTRACEYPEPDIRLANGMTMSQIIYSVLFLANIALIIHLLKKQKSTQAR